MREAAGALSGTLRWPSRRHPLWLWLGYFTLYLLLDWVSYVEPLHSSGVTPWNPNTGLTLALLLRVGAVAGPLVTLSVFAGERLTGVATSWVVLALASVHIALVYIVTAWYLRRRALAPPFATPRAAARFVAVTVVAAASAAAGYSGIHVVAGLLRPDEFWASTSRLWIGDVNGIVALVPVLCFDLKRRSLREQLWLWRQSLYLRGTAVALSLCLALAVAAARDPHLFYALFAPVAWLALRFGVAGGMAAVAVVQLVLVMALKFTPGPVSVFDMQFPLVSLGLTTLFLGTLAAQRDTALRTVGEQENSLRRLTRFAAVGELSSALAHELNQPMTALLWYVRACEAMARADPRTDQRLGAALNKSAQQAVRATEVLRRLREFYRGEGTCFEPTDVFAVCSHVADSQRDSMHRVGIYLDVRCSGEPPPVRADRTQFEIVIYNLLTNALEALAAAPADRPRRVELLVSGESAGVRVTVDDSGPGIAAHVAAHLFDPFVTDKSGGMGLGLALSRTLLRHQGGDLWCEASRLGGARFVVWLAAGEGQGDS
jgi:signal transduction histidine kinase